MISGLPSPLGYGWPSHEVSPKHGVPLWVRRMRRGISGSVLGFLLREANLRC